MRRILAAAVLCIATMLTAGQSQARESADCVVVYSLSGPVCVERSAAKVQKAAKKERTATVAGREFKPSPSVSWHSSGAAWLAQAKVHIGKRGADLSVKHRRLWCGEFVCRAMAEVGKPCPPGYAKASQWANVGRRLSGPQVGAIAVYHHHVGIVADVKPDGSIILLSGNYNDRVHEGPYRSRGLIGYYWPEA